MKKDIYFGNIVALGVTAPTTRPMSYVDDTTLTFTGFDLTGVPMSNKLDLLFYNRVNEIGEVLSSLVYISNVLEIDDVTDKVYDMTKLYVNTEAEVELAITDSMTDFTYLNCKWESNKYFNTSISPLAGYTHDELALNGIPSIKLDEHGIAFDGWYTQMSVGVRAITGGVPPVAYVKGLLGIHTFADVGDKVAVYMDANPGTPLADENWNVYTDFATDGTVNPDDSVLVEGTSLGSILVTTVPENPFIKQELFILPNYLAIYDDAAIQYAENPTYGNPFPTLRNKHRVIHNFAENNEYVEAQYILQSTDLLRMSTQL